MTKKIEDGGPAFAGRRFEPQHRGSNDREPWNPGMSLRDWFAGHALNGAWAGRNNESIELVEGQTVDDAILADWLDVARCAYIAADAMLAARKTGEA